MSLMDVLVPAVGESIHQVTLVKWNKADGSWVERDEVICELESEKATFELGAEQGGKLMQVAAEGDDLAIGQLVARIDMQAVRPAPQAEPLAAKSVEPLVLDFAEKTPAAEVPASDILPKATPLAAQLMAQMPAPVPVIKGSGSLGRITRQDVVEALQTTHTPEEGFIAERTEKQVKMSNLRKTISRRLVDVKNQTAMLTTFNEVDMSELMRIRQQYKEAFKKQHGVNLGYMSFFAKACCIALQEWPSIQARIEGDQLIYPSFTDLSIAVSTDKGLVVPVIRNAEQCSIPALEHQVAGLAARAREHKLSMEEMSGGTFTITNGGVFGSLMSTPILNSPQSGILGMHKIQERPVAMHGQVVIRPMMYVALSYDHRVVDGRESVSFLVRVKELLEQPQQLLNGRDPFMQLLSL